jgi:hypothetical protein
MFGRNRVFNRERASCKLLVLKLIHTLKPCHANNVSSWDSFVEKEHPI